MKFSRFITILLALLVLQALSQISRTLDRISTIDSNILRPTIAILPSADCYDGTVNVDVAEGTSSYLTYIACFAKTTTNCGHLNCYNGWIAHYNS